MHGERAEDKTPGTTQSRMRSSSAPKQPSAMLLGLQRDAGNTAVADAIAGSGDATGATPTFPIWDRTTRAKKFVDATAYEAERTSLGRLLRYDMKAIPEDAKKVLEEYPYEEVKDMYSDSMDSLGRAAKYYSQGDLLHARVWVREAGKYVDIEIKAHKIFQGESVWSYVGKRVGLAVIGIFEGAADSLLGLVDMGAGLVGVHPGLVEWNTQRYNTIKGGFSSVTGIDHTLVSDDELGRFGGKVAGGLALGGGIAKAARGGSVAAQFLMFTQVGGGIKMTVDGIGVMRGQGKSWGEIFSDPAVIAQIAGGIAGVAGLGSAAMPAMRDFLNQIGLVATAAQMSGMTATLIKIQNDTTLTDEQRQQQFLDATATLIVAVGLTADQVYGAKQPASTPEPAAAKPSVHERFDLSDTPDGAQPAPMAAPSGGGRMGSGRVGGSDSDGPAAGDTRTTTRPAPHDNDVVTDLGDTIEPPKPATAPPKSSAPPQPANASDGDVQGRFDVSDTPAPVEYSAGSAKSVAAGARVAVDQVAAAAGEVTAVIDRVSTRPGAASETVAAARRTITRLSAEANKHSQRAAEAAENAAAARKAGDYKTERTEAKVADYNANQARRAAQEATRVALAAQIDGVNPSGSMENCGHVVEAVEARLNGANPDAQARSSGNLYLDSTPRPGGIRHELSIGEQYDGSFDVSTEPKVTGNLAGRGEGAQGVVTVDWLGSDGRVLDIGHVFNAVYKNGAAYFLDGQTGNVATTIADLFPGARIGTIRYMPIDRR